MLVSSQTCQVEFLLSAISAPFSYNLLNVLLRAWLTRAWTVQEVTMGRWVQVYCGPKQKPIGFETMIYCLIPPDCQVLPGGDITWTTLEAQSVQTCEHCKTGRDSPSNLLVAT